MIDTLVLSAILSAIIAAVVANWIVSRRRTVQLEGLEIVDGNGLVLGKLAAFDGGVGLALGAGDGRVRLNVGVDPNGRPEIVLRDDKGVARLSFAILEVPEEFALTGTQINAMSPEEIGRAYNERIPYRPVMFCYDEAGKARSAVSTDSVVLYAGNDVPVVSLASGLPGAKVASPGLLLKNQAEDASVLVSVLTPDRPHIECRRAGRLIDSWPKGE